MQQNTEFQELVACAAAGGGLFAVSRGRSEGGCFCLWFVKWKMSLKHNKQNHQLAYVG